MSKETVINGSFYEFAAKSELHFADAGFLASEYFMDVFYPMLNSYNSLKHRRKIEVCVLPFCIMDLRKMTISADTALAQRAQYALDTICRDMRRNRNFLEYRSGVSDTSSDAALLCAALMERLRSSISVLTQNKMLTSDLYSFNDLKSCKGELISVYSFNEDGILHKS